MTLRPASIRRLAFFAVPPPPRQTRASIPSFSQFSTMVGTMSRGSPSIIMRCSLSRLVPSMVPPVVRIPDRAAGSSSVKRFSARPRIPSRKPTSSQPCCWIAAFPKPRTRRVESRGVAARRENADALSHGAKYAVPWRPAQGVADPDRRCHVRRPASIIITLIASILREPSGNPTGTLRSPSVLTHLCP